jgi:hypothetical protein
MDMGIVNAAQVKADVYEEIDKELLGYVEDVLLNRRDDATERMLEFAARLDPKCRPTALRRLQAEARQMQRPRPPAVTDHWALVACVCRATFAASELGHSVAAAGDMESCFGFVLRALEERAMELRGQCFLCMPCHRAGAVHA